MQTKVDYAAGRLTVADPRVFHAGRQALTSLLIRELGCVPMSERHGSTWKQASCASIGLAPATHPPGRAADVFTGALQSARRIDRGFEFLQSVNRGAAT
jgi:hypothetical protein